MSKIVLAHDCSNADPETLGEDYREESDAEVSTGIRWFYCGGLALALFSMSLISMSHIHKTIPNARLGKKPRLAIRCSIALIILLLPLAKHESISSLSLMCITCSLVVLALIVDVYGVSCQGDQFWRGGFCDAEKKRCRYSANFNIDKRTRRQLDRKIKRGDKVTIEDLLKSSAGAGGAGGAAAAAKNGASSQETTAVASVATSKLVSIDSSTLTSTANSSQERLARPKAFHLHSFAAV